jgi:dUTP pyrophosphatase
MELKVRYHFEKYPNMVKIKTLEQGDYFDLAVAEDICMKAGEFKYISLGISMKAPEGYLIKIYPRSSTFKNYGLIQANSVGIIDESYSGDNDIIHFPAYATRDIEIKAGERIAQFTIEKKIEFNIKEVDKLEGPDRGGLGSTGKM